MRYREPTLRIRDLRGLTRPPNLNSLEEGQIECGRNGRNGVSISKDDMRSSIAPQERHAAYSFGMLIERDMVFSGAVESGCEVRE